MDDHKATSSQHETSLQLVVQKKRGVSSLKSLCLVAAERGLGLGARQVQAATSTGMAWDNGACWRKSVAIRIELCCCMLGFFNCTMFNEHCSSSFLKHTEVAPSPAGGRPAPSPHPEDWAEGRGAQLLEQQEAAQDHGDLPPSQGKEPGGQGPLRLRLVHYMHN